jgi:hypothetical protein
MIAEPSNYESRVVLTRPPCWQFDVTKLLQGAVVIPARGNTIGGSKIQALFAHLGNSGLWCGTAAPNTQDTVTQSLTAQNTDTSLRQHAL